MTELQKNLLSWFKVYCGWILVYLNCVFRPSSGFVICSGHVSRWRAPDRFIYYFLCIFIIDNLVWDFDSYSLVMSAGIRTTDYGVQSSYHSSLGTRAPLGGPSRSIGVLLNNVINYNLICMPFSERTLCS